MDTAPSTHATRIASLDALRGLSILLVVLHHMGIRIRLHKGVLATLFPARFLEGLIFNGYEAVLVFFVLSGFLITTRAIDRWGSLEAIDRRAFYTRRAARIVPCLVALVAVLSALHLAGVDGYVISREGQSLGGAVFAALALHLNLYEGKTGYLPGGWDVLWSLSIEEVFYVAFPLVTPILARLRLLAPLLFLFAISLPATRAALEGNEIWQEKAYLPGMAAIATGVLAAWVAARARTMTHSIAAALVGLGGASLVVVFFFEVWLWKDLSLGNGTNLILTFGTAALTVGLHRLGANATATPARSLAWLRSMGRLSYEIYLTHMFVVLSVVAAWKRLGSDVGWGALAYPPAVLLSWLLGGLVARGLTQPIERAIVRRGATSMANRERSMRQTISPS